jgi:hypothetical protein
LTAILILLEDKSNVDPSDAHLMRSVTPVLQALTPPHTCGYDSNIRTIKDVRATVHIAITKSTVGRILLRLYLLHTFKAKRMER